MKVLFFHRWVGVHAGGTETHLLELARRFAALGHDITILTREGRELKGPLAGIRVIRVARGPGESEHSYEDWRVYFYTFLFLCKSLLRLAWLRLKGEKFDIISVHFTTEAIAARIYRFFFRTPFIFILEGYTPLEAGTARYADARVAISGYEAEVYKERHGIPSEVIHIGVDLSRFSVAREYASELRDKLLNGAKLLVLTVCRLEPRKDLFTLIEAARIVRSRRDDIKFIVVGDGISAEKLKRQIDTERLTDTVSLSGFVSSELLPYYYAASDIFALTSREEWFGIVFLEAMASGLPVIASNVDASPEVVDGCGVFFEKGDAGALAEKIILLAEDEALRKELSLKARARSKEFSWDKQILVYQKAYQDLLKE